MKKMIALVLVLMMAMFAACAEETAVFDTLEDEEVATVSAEAFEAEAFNEAFAEAFNEPETAEISISADRDSYEFGDTVRLTANVCASRGFSVRWQVNDGSGWQDTGVQGESFSYTANEDTANNSYRAVLVMA